MAFRRAVADAVRRARRIVCDSAYVAGQIRERFDVASDRLVVVPLGVGDEFRRPVDASTRADVAQRLELPERYFLTVGAVNARKNLIPLLRALAVGRPAPLVLAGGRGRGAEAVAAEVERLGLTDLVRFAGYVGDADLPAVMAGALALVHPGAHEGFGFTPLEAMAVGTPVITAASGSLPELVGDAGVQVAPDDVDAWAAALTEMAGDGDGRARLAAAGRARSAAYTWARTTAATAAVYEDCLD